MFRIFMIIVLTLAIGYFLFGNRMTERMTVIEGLTNDEAIQNIASLYNKDKMIVTDLDVTGSLTGPTIQSINDNITKQANALDARITSLQATLNAELNNYVRKGPINLVVSYKNGYNTARTNHPIWVSDNYFLRSYPNIGDDSNYNKLGGTFSIL